MRLHELTEGRFLPPPKSKWTPMKILRSILGRRVTDNDNNTKSDSYVVSGSWVSGMPLGMFSNMDQPPGGGGAIGLPNPHGNTIGDLVAAIHEGYHAYLHMTKQDFKNEKTVNELSEAWIMKNMQGIEQKKALDYLQISKNSYGH